MMAGDSRPIVLDIGSWEMKLGFAGDPAPIVTFPSIVGRPRKGDGPVEVADNAILMRGDLNTNHPIQDGRINNWEDTEALLKYAFSSVLQVNPAEHPILLTETHDNPRTNREKSLEVLFETFNTPACYLSLQPLMTLFSCGKTSGIVVDIGYTSTRVVPILDGFPLLHAARTLDIGGNDVTQTFQQLLENSELLFASVGGENVLNGIKERLGYVAMDCDQECQRSESEVTQSYELPDGRLISVGQARYKCPEILFNPQRTGKETDGIPNIVSQSLDKCGENTDVISTLVVNGGTSMFPGLSSRIINEVGKLSSDVVHLKEPSSKVDQKYRAWFGGSLLAALPSFEDHWVTRQLYEEYGKNIVHGMCF